MTNPIIVALDLASRDKALQWVNLLRPVVTRFKVGSELFTSAGPEVVRSIRATGATVFLDLKFHDIPNTVTRACAAAARLDVQMITLHTSGGLDMMRAAQDAVRDTCRQLDLVPPVVLGVTILTSLTSKDLEDVGQTPNIAHQVERLATLASRAGLGGLVCSPLELAALRALLPDSMQLVTPGIRSTADASDDQKRTLSAKEALDAGANWLVIGRPITAAPNPRAAAEEILKSLKPGSSPFP